MRVAMKHAHPNDDPPSFIEVRYLDREPGGLVSVIVGEGGATARWTMTPVLAADLIAALSRALAETMAVREAMRAICVWPEPHGDDAEHIALVESEPVLFGADVGEKWEART